MNDGGTNVERVGVVVIGRNEGERLRRCLESVRGACVVYVDSGSSDGSEGLAREMGAEVVMLDARVPFSAARARNEGLERLRQMQAGAELVQFVDGDCEMMTGWIEAAAEFMDGNERCAAVAGRLRERHAEGSVYNRLCDLEWDVAAGEVGSCGGIAMYRVAAFVEVGGFDGAVIAGEEPELCLRLRRRRWKVVRMARDMAWHDAAMMRFGQWWRRAVRSGHAYAMGAAMHGDGPERHCVREAGSMWFWGLGVPVIAGGLAWWTKGLSMMLLACYVMLAGRVAWRKWRQGRGAGDAWLYAVSCVAAKFAGVQGMCRYWVGRMLSRPAAVMEYKRAQAVADQ